MASSSEQQRSSQGGRSVADAPLLVVVGSGNPCKVTWNEIGIGAVREAFRLVYPQAELRVEGVDVESGVSCQPFSDLETYRGALTRARNAAAAWAAKGPGERGADFAVGLEGGVREEELILSPSAADDDGDDQEERRERSLHCFAWMVVLELSTGRVGAAKTGSFPLPKPVVELVHSGVELGHASDQVFRRVDSKQGAGAVGILTGGIINRAPYYTHALVLALIPFQHRDMY